MPNIELTKTERILRCPKCKKMLPENKFHNNKSTLNGKECYCKSCKYLFNKTKFPYSHKKHVNHPRYCMLSSAKRRAKVKNMKFNIELSDIIIPEHCPILNIKLIVNKGFAKENSPTLDRIDSNKGYIKGNIAVISNRANRLKDNSTIRELELILDYMKNFAQEELCQ